MSAARKAPTRAPSGAVHLVLFADGAPGDAMAWLQVDGRNGETLERGVAAPGQAPPAAAPARTVLVVSGADAQVRRVALPARTEAQARAGAAYQFDGALLERDETHFAIGAAQDGEGHRLVAAMSAARLHAWLDACRALGANPASAYLDVTLWPASDDAIEIVPLHQRALVCAGRYGGYAIEAPLAGALLSRWAMQNGLRPSRIGLDRRLADTLKLEPLAGAPQVITADAGAVDEELARAAIAAPDYAPNLRQGAYSVDGARTPRWKVWATAYALALIALLVQSGVQMFDAWRDGQSAQTVLAQAEQEFRAARPDVTRIVNLPAQVRAIANAATQAGDHPVLKLTAPLLRARQAQPNARLDELRFTAPGRSVEVRFSATTPAPLEAIAADLRAQGLAIGVRETRAEAGRFVVALSVEAPR